MRIMEIIEVYKCLCDIQRLRILNLLQDGPLCVCHLVEILDSDQVKVSKQLRYMKELEMVEDERVAQWKVYRLANASNRLLQANLKCLQDCYGEDLAFAEDLRKRSVVVARTGSEGAACARAVNARSPELHPNPQPIEEIQT